MEAQCWESASGGSYHSVALQTDGSIWSWGNSCCSEAGGEIFTAYNPTQIGTSNDWMSVSTESSGSIAIKNDGSLWFWGAWSGNTNVPSQVGTDVDWALEVASFSGCFAIKANHTLWGWGNNSQGQLGDGTTIYRPTIVQIGTDSNWSAISSGENHTVAIKTDGTLWAWGTESYGQLGNGAGANQSLFPMQIGTSTDWQSVKCGSSYTIALKTDGTLWTWGRNNTGQLGNGTTINKLEPTLMGTDSDWESMDPGYFFCYARKTDGSLWAWGSNYAGQLSIGTTVDQYLPVPVTSITDIDQYSASGYTALFIKTDDSLWMSGANNFGQLGNGTTSFANTLPIIVSCQALDVKEFANSNSIIIYPNPAHEHFNVKKNIGDSIVSIDIIDSNGKLVLKNYGYLPRIDIHNFKTGIYLVKIVLENDVILRKLVKM